MSNDLKRELKEGDLGYGDAAAGKALKFLHHVEKDKEGRKKEIFGCRRHIEALCTVKERRRTDKSNVIRFNGPNKLFFVKPKPRRFWSEVRKLLTEIQRWLLTSSESGLFGSYYLSSFETRKLAPFPADYVSDSLDKLLDLGFLQEVTVDISKIHKRRPKTVSIPEILNGLKNGSLKKRLELPSEYLLSFLTIPKRSKTLVESKRSAILEELVEYETANHVHMRIVHKYRALIEHSPLGSPYYGMRMQNPDIAKFTKGYTFDSFYKFRDRKLGVDVYTRLPLSEAAVHVFKAKIGAVRCFGRIYACESMSDKVDQLCKEYSINLIYLKKTSINYNKVRQEIESKLVKAGF